MVVPAVLPTYFWRRFDAEIVHFDDEKANIQHDFISLMSHVIFWSSVRFSETLIVWNFPNCLEALEGLLWDSNFELSVTFESTEHFVLSWLLLMFEVMFSRSFQDTMWLQQSALATFSIILEFVKMIDPDLAVSDCFSVESAWGCVLPVAPLGNQRLVRRDVFCRASSSSDS